MRNRIVPGAAIFLLAASLLFAQGRLGMDFTPGLVPITEDVYAYEGQLQLAGEEEILRVNSLVVVTDEGVLVADGQANPDEGRRLLGEIRKVTSLPVRFIVNASPHGDHTGSNNVFPEAVILSHVNARKAMAETLELQSGVGIRPRLPEVLYSDQMILQLGDKRIELRYFGAGHTEGDTVVYLPDDKVAFLSELYFNGVFASVAEGHAQEHLETLSKIMELDVEWFLPAHGLIRDQSPAQLRAGLTRYYDNVQAIQDLVLRHLERGDSLETTLSHSDQELGDFARLPFYGFLKERSISGVYNRLSKER